MEGRKRESVGQGCEHRSLSKQTDPGTCAPLGACRERERVCVGVSESESVSVSKSERESVSVSESESSLPVSLQQPLTH